MTPLAAKFQQALALHQQGQLTRAEATYEEILREQPEHFDALHLSGVIAAQTNNPARALQLIGKAIDINPHDANAFCNQGSALTALEQFAAALRSYDKAIIFRPDYAEAHCCRATVLRELGRWEEALESCAHAIAIRPNYADAFCSQGKIFKEIKRWDSALASHDSAIALRPDFAEAFTERGIVLRELGQLEAALASHERAIAINGNLAHAYLNRGNVLVDLNRLDAALESFSRAIVLKADFAEAHANRSTVLLLRGDLVKGWSDYEWRWKLKRNPIARHKRNFSQPLWTGREPIEGRIVLLHAEQGFGDTLQFCRYASLVAERGAGVILQVPKPLVSLLTTLNGVPAVFADTEALPPFDYYCPLMSLPAVFGTSLSTILPQVPYLSCTAAKRQFWKQKLGDRRRRRVGLVWSGGFRPHQPELWAVNSRRNVPLANFAVLRHPDIDFYSLQKGQPAEAEWTDLKTRGWDGPQLIDCTDLLQDFADTAALVEQLDLVIAVDTSTAHLAGALGKPVWLLNRFDTCWRWMLDRSDSPWYPSMRIYRQARPGDWAEVLQRVRIDLDAPESRQ